jgi:hypothetical protein
MPILRTQSASPLQRQSYQQVPQDGELVIFYINLYKENSLSQRVTLSRSGRESPFGGVLDLILGDDLLHK